VDSDAEEHGEGNELEQHLDEEGELVLESDALGQECTVVVALLDAGVALEAVFGLYRGHLQLALVALILVELDYELQAHRHLHVFVAQRMDVLI